MSQIRALSKLKLHGGAQFVGVTEFPASPTLGDTAFKGGILYIYADIGGMSTWYPTNRPQASYVHSQGAASLTWTINHNLGSTDVIVAVYDQDGYHTLADVQAASANQVLVSLTEAITGHAVVFGVEQVSAPTIVAQTLEVSDSIRVGGSEVITTADQIDLGEIS